MSAQHEMTESIQLTSLSNPALEQAQFPIVTQQQLAWEDIEGGIKQWRIWFMLAYQDIKLRYRRSILGPFWLTLSMAITVYSMGYLYAHLFHIELAHYFPFLVAGMLGWSLISTLLLEFTDGFITADGLIKQIKLPYTLYIHRIATRNLLIFFHNILVIVPILIIYHESVPLNWTLFLSLPGLAVIYLNACFYGLILAMLGARYRDISQIIKSLVQVIFFITPVMWDPAILDNGRRFIVNYNPFYDFLQLIRAPLLGQLPTLHNVYMVTAITFLGLLISYHLFTRYRSRIIYWL